MTGVVASGMAVSGLVASGALAAACGGPYGGGSPAQQLGTWARSTGFSASVSRLRDDLARVGAGSADAGALRTACDVLVTDALAANQQLPSPDAALTARLSGAYGSAAAAGRDCFRGAGGDGALLARSASERDAARAALVRAEARFDEVTSSLPGSGS